MAPDMLVASTVHPLTRKGIGATGRRYLNTRASKHFCSADASQLWAAGRRGSIIDSQAYDDCLTSERLALHSTSNTITLRTASC